MKNKTSGIFATIFFTLISILFVSPILIVLMNSFKKKAFISGTLPAYRTRLQN